MVSTRDWGTPPTVEPLKYNLLSAAERDTFSGHQKLGVQFMPSYCGPALSLDAVCVSGTGLDTTKTPNPGGVPTRASDPFIVYAWIDCGFVGMDYAELLQRTRTALDAGASYAVERVFWTGEFTLGPGSVSPHLAANTPIIEVSGGSTTYLQTAATVITGTHDVVGGIAALESAMSACYVGTPFLHVPRIVTPYLASNHLIKDTSGPRLLTTGNESVIVPGAGYFANTGPDGAPAAAGTAWIYATGKVKYYEGETIETARTPAQALARSTNDVVLVLERRYVVEWDCCHFAVNVTLS